MAIKARQQSPDGAGRDKFETFYSTLHPTYHSYTYVRKICERLGNDGEISANHEPTGTVTT